MPPGARWDRPRRGCCRHPARRSPGTPPPSPRSSSRSGSPRVAATAFLSLSQVRPTLAQVLAPMAPGDPEVLTDYPDTVTPPALVVVWDDPWLEQPTTMGPCDLTANLVVLCVGSRIEAGPGIDMVEEMVAFTIDRLRADAYRWPLASTQAPREWVISNVHYLAARLAVRVPVAI